MISPQRTHKHANNRAESSFRIINLGLLCLGIIFLILAVQSTFELLELRLFGFDANGTVIRQEIEEISIYNALLESRYTGNGLRQVLIIDHTDVNHTALLEQDLAQFQKNTPLAPEMVINFKQRNQQFYPLEPVLDFGVGYQLLSQAEIDDLRPLDVASSRFQGRFRSSPGLHQHLSLRAANRGWLLFVDQTG